MLSAWLSHRHHLTSSKNSMPGYTAPRKMSHLMREPALSVKAIIFDLDGTLYRMRWFMKPLITIRLFPHCLRLPRFIAVRDTLAGQDFGTGDALLAELGSRLARRMRARNPMAMRAWILDRFYAEFQAAMPLMGGAREGLSDTLAAARSKGIRTAVLSDYNRVEERLAGLGINRFQFDLIGSAESLGALKPCPRPFLQMASAWELEPGSVLVIGDRDDTDGASARAAGMRFIQVSNKKRPAGKSRTWAWIKTYINDLPEVTAETGPGASPARP
ncbi:MAG: HAD hydrolase-like protein [Chitinivibrionales bacterium]|nr:HAD hydrolase-like protein [Chitinivibrionales bacterium]MBD3395763.1 HAD hydrolase-like protein [Chitinivibrionales bacterium]